MQKYQVEIQLSKFQRTMKRFKETFRKLYCFACICAFALASIGGIAYLFYDTHAVFAVAAIATTGMAVPYLIERIKEIMG